MTRFDAATAEDRRVLFAEAVGAHRERSSPFVTLEADPDSVPESTLEAGVPWLQVAEDTINLDCTDDELDRLTDLLAEFPAFTIDAMESPEEAEGTNVRVTARADDHRIAEFCDRTFGAVYDLPEDYRAWVVDL